MNYNGFVLFVDFRFRKDSWFGNERGGRVKGGSVGMLRC